ncbi:MAG: TonB-dependent receptor plug domain-containing protein [Sphingobacteriaceae bacterium]
MYSKKTAFVLMSLGLSWSAVKAQEIKKDTTRLKEVVIVASRFPENKEDVAQRVQVIKAERIKELNAANAADILQQTPGILVQKSQLGGGSPVIRGFEANKVLLVVDGVRMNNAIYRAGHLQNVITLDNEALDRIEVGFGPSSVSYGSDALGGVIHAYTKNPELGQFKVSLMSRYASAANAFSEGLSVNIGKNKWASLSNFSYSKFGDLRQGGTDYKNNEWKSLYTVSRQGTQDVVSANENPDVQWGSAYHQVDWMQKLLYKQNEHLSHLINFQYSTSSNVPRYDRLAQLSGGLPKYAEWYYGPQRRLMASYQMQLNGYKGWFDQSNITLAYQDIEESRHDRKLNNTSLNNRIEQVGVFSVNADFDKKFGEQELSYGLEFTHNDVNSSAYKLNVNTGVQSALDTRYPDGGSQLTTAAAFLAHRWEMSKKWLLSSGLRLNLVNLRSKFNDQTFFPFPFNSVKQNNVAWSGNLGLIYKPGNDWHLALLGSTGFRAPNVDDLAKVFESLAGSIIVPNPDLKPEYTYNAEFSVEKYFTNQSSFHFNAFYTWYRDAITTQPFLFNGQSQIMYNGTLSNVTASVNAAKAYLYGFSGGFNLPIAGKVWFKNEATYTFARISSASPEQPLDHIPPFFGSSSLNYKHKKYEAEFSIQYNGAKKLKNYNPNGEDNLPQATPTGMPSWYTLNFRNGYQLNQKLKLQLALENILDQNYRVFASGISAPGRNFVISLRGNL